MSDIRLSVSHLDKASLGYSDIVASDPDNVAALVGLSKAELLRARNNFSSGLVKAGHSHCMNALSFALRATKLSPYLCLTWKLAADCCLTQFICGQRGSFSTKINVQFPGSDQDGLIINRFTCIEIAQQFLCKALAIEPFQESGCLWHNLGISLYLKSTLIAESKEREALLKRSLKCLFNALNYDRDNSQVRNSIGIVAFNLNYLNSAQNFIIKSIQTNLSTSEKQFSNLGYIYLQKGEYRLASVAFSRCQAEEPLYCRSWLGNALLNEQNNLDNLSFLRHCHKLENNYESQVMYASKVTSLPFTEEYERDLVSALDCMRRIVNYDECSLEVKNTLGLLYERCKYQDQARLCFEEAYNIAPQDSRVIFNRLRQHRAPESCSITTDQATTIDVDFIKSAERLASSGNNREYILNFIYYLFNNRDYKGINSRMTKLIDKFRQDDIKDKIGAQVLLALTAKSEGNDFKSWLFKNVIDSEDIICVESLINMLCLMILGSVTDDHQLVEQTSNYIAKYLLAYISTKTIQFTNLFYSIEGFWTRLVLISSIFCLRDQGKLVRPLVALYPTVAELWLYLGLSLMFQKAKHHVAIFCIKKASLIGSTDSNLCVVCDILLAILSQQVKTKPKYLDGDRVVYLSRAIFKQPDYDLLWKSLLSARGHEQQGRSKKSQLVNENDSGLFQLAIDHTIKMIVEM